MVETKNFHGMKYRRMGHSGLWVSEVGLGLWKWGDPSYDGARVGEHEGYTILDRALELGVTHWDTANSYNMGSGNSERLLGRYFLSRGSRLRQSVILATKVRNSVRDPHEMKREFAPFESGASRRYLIRAVEDCLLRLHTDWIDVLYHHSPSLLPDGSWETPLDETWDAMNMLVQQGKVRYLAVSNRSATQLKMEQDALATVAGNSSRRIVGVQNHYSLLERPRVAALGEGAVLEDEGNFMDYLSKSQIGLVPYFPLAAGMLTGRYLPGKMDTQGRLSAQSGEGLGERFITERSLNIVVKLDAIARSKGCSMAQLAIAWLLAKAEVCSVIAGVTRLGQLEDNAGAASVSLTGEDLEELDNLTK